MAHKAEARNSGALHRWAKGAYAAVVGAAAAALLGYGLNAGLSALGLALAAPVRDVPQTAHLFFARAGLNFHAIHHIRIVGGSLPGGPSGTYVSVFWPITVWAILPAAALMVGGSISARLAGARGPARFAAGAWLAIPYVVLLAIARPFSAVPSVSIDLPKIAGTGLAPESVPALLAPALGSTIYHGLLFGILFGGIGGLGGLRIIWRGLVQRDAFWPSWARAAVIGIAAAQALLFVVLSVAFVAALNRVGRGREEIGACEAIRLWAAVAPACAGDAHYFAHGVTLRGSRVTQPGIPEARPIVQSYRVGLAMGIASDDETRPLPRWTYLAFVVPAGMLILAGFAAAKTANEPIRRPALAAGLASAYALLLTALTPCYTLTIKTAITAGGVTTHTTAAVGPSAAQAFALGLVLAFIFGFIGVNLCRRYARA